MILLGEIYKLMSKHIHYIYTIVLLCISIALIISYHNNNVLESRLNTTNKAIYKRINVDTLSSEKSFKEDYYILQQSSDTNLILCCIGIGFAIFSFFTYQSVIVRMDFHVRRMKKNYIAHEDKYNLQHKKLIKLDLDLKNGIAQSYSIKADLLLNSNPPDYNGCILYKLLSCEKYSEVLDLATDENDLFKESMYRTIIDELVYLNTEIKTTYNISNIDPDRHNKRIQRINKIIKIENMPLFHAVFSKITINQETA